MVPTKVPSEREPQEEANTGVKETQEWNESHPQGMGSGKYNDDMPKEWSARDMCHLLIRFCHIVLTHFKLLGMVTFVTTLVVSDHSKWSIK